MAPITRYRYSRGITLIDVIVGVALAMLIFVGLFGAFRLSVELIALSKARSGALALANERMELLRSLSYDDVGTAGGIPSGAVAQTETISLNRTVYTRRTLILYVDDPLDGTGGADANGITTDYKQTKVEVSWAHRGRDEQVSLVTNIVPKGIESTAGGGTIRVTVVDALAQPVSGASVQVENASLSPTIDTTVYTNLDGVVLIGGAPAGSNYEITVTKDGYSSAGTYSASAANPNPSPGHLAVVAGNTTSGTFAIDALAQKTVRTLAPVTNATFTDPFLDSSLLAAMASTTVAGGALSLTQNAGIYDPSGTARSNPVTDAYLYRWNEARFDPNNPSGTAALVKVYYDTGSGFALVPDGALPGNSSGFTASPVNLSSLSTTTYSTLALFAELSTSDVLQTPTVADWELRYQVGPTPIPNAAFSMRGTKTIGTRADSSLIYKYDVSTTTNSSGTRTFPALEWDTYQITLGSAGYDVAEACLPQPRTIAPGDAAITRLFLVAGAAHTLLVSASTDDGIPIEGANVQVSNGGYSNTLVTGECGGAFFTPLSSGSYDITVSATGFTTATSTVSVSGDASSNFTLTP